MHRIYAFRPMPEIPLPNVRILSPPPVLHIWYREVLRDRTISLILEVFTSWRSGLPSAFKFWRHLPTDRGFEPPTSSSSALQYLLKENKRKVWLATTRIPPSPVPHPARKIWSSHPYYAKQRREAPHAATPAAYDVRYTEVERETQLRCVLPQSPSSPVISQPWRKQSAAAPLASSTISRGPPNARAGSWCWAGEISVNVHIYPSTRWVSPCSPQAGEKCLPWAPYLDAAPVGNSTTGSFEQKTWNIEICQERPTRFGGA